MSISSQHSRPSSSSGPASTRRLRRGGFTLIELLVVSAIVLLITAFVMLRQDKFNSSTLLRSLAYSIGLSLRQAQIYSTSVRETTPGSGVFSSGFGVYFDSALACQTGTPSTCYSFFGDANGNGSRDITPAEEVSLYSLGKGYRVSDFCAVDAAGVVVYCNSAPAGPTHIDSLNIFFKRPNPEPCVSTSGGLGGSCATGAAATGYGDAFVIVKSSGNDDARSVKVSASGQLSICQLNMTPPAC